MKKLRSIYLLIFASLISTAFAAPTFEEVLRMTPRGKTELPAIETTLKEKGLIRSPYIPALEVRRTGESFSTEIWYISPNTWQSAKIVIEGIESPTQGIIIQNISVVDQRI